MTKRQILRAALFLMFPLVLGSVVNAETITLSSAGTAANSNQFNSMGNTIAIDPNSVWGQALGSSSWVSFAQTGNTSNPGFTSVANGTMVSFFDSFNVVGTATGGSITIMADDSAAIYLNGVLLMPEASQIGNTYHLCSDSGIGCLVGYTVNLPANLMHSGKNTIEFDVAQRNGVSFGLDYSGEVTTTPEPGSLALLASGLFGIAGLARRRMRQRPV